ncbi:hypothetical protein L209DRAFT_756805 [Thermothelomyces heterothallicus CBS 203.75]
MVAWQYFAPTPPTNSRYTPPGGAPNLRAAGGLRLDIISDYGHPTFEWRRMALGDMTRAGSKIFLLL